ncbi:hypothetical protein C8Q80DRAFT_902489 [Daedaleopsis nitida]|nr:hypothetical protein C8Q80DRAFT_902489 [Daedaleopsis nitida]
MGCGCARRTIGARTPTAVQCRLRSDDKGFELDGESIAFLLVLANDSLVMGARLCHCHGGDGSCSVVLSASSLSPSQRPRICNLTSLDAFRLDMVNETAGKIIGVSVEDIINSLIPDWDDIPLTAIVPRKDAFKELEGADRLNENQLAEKWMAVVNDNDLSEGLKFALSRFKCDKGDESRQRVDGAFFDKDRVLTNDAPNWPDQVVSVEFKVEDIGKDSFHDLSDGTIIEADAATRVNSHGQNVSYAEHIFTYQHRTVHFSLLIMGRYFRAMCWERSGVMVTPRTNYVQDSSSLCRLLWAFGWASRKSKELLGFDPTGTRLYPGDEEYEAMTDAMERQDSDIDLSPEPIPTYVPVSEFNPKPTFTYVRNAFRKSLVDPLWPRYKLSVPQADGSTRSFLVGKPAFIARGLVGRGTRGFVALDRSSGRFVYLKDAWRAHYQLLEREGDILAKLTTPTDEFPAVRNVPTLVCHGDLDGQRTRCPELWDTLHPSEQKASPSPPPPPPPPSEPSIPEPPLASETAPPEKSTPSGGASTAGSSTRKNPFKRHQHYRIVVEEVCMPLSSFRNGRELLLAVWECFDAHYVATLKDQILHCDVSGGNILLYPKAERLQDAEGNVVGYAWGLGGILTDWELAKRITDLLPKQLERTGTWQFMSAAALFEPQKALVIADDIESFLHVVIYYAIRYLCHSCTNVYHFMHDYFDGYSLRGQVPVCGTKKRCVMRFGELAYSSGPITFHSPTCTETHPLNRIISEMLARFRAYYRELELARVSSMQKPGWEPSRPSTPTPRPTLGGIRVTSVRNTHPCSLAFVGTTPDDGPAVSLYTSALSAAEKKWADSVKTHHYFGKIIRHTISRLEAEWPLDDKRGDQLAPYVKVVRNKRSRKDNEEEDDTFGVFSSDHKRFRVSTTSFVSGQHIMVTNSWALEALETHAGQFERKTSERPSSPDCRDA